MKKCFFHFVLLSVCFLSLVLFLAPVDPDQPMSNLRYGTYQVKSLIDQSLATVTGREDNSDILKIELKSYVRGRKIASVDPQEPATSSASESSLQVADPGTQ